MVWVRTSWLFVIIGISIVVGMVQGNWAFVGTCFAALGVLIGYVLLIGTGRALWDRWHNGPPPSRAASSDPRTSSQRSCGPSTAVTVVCEDAACDANR